jgi:hypothetical protein
MGFKAQAGLEYLVTYGWALVIVATLVGAIFFVQGPSDGAIFSSSDPSKMPLLSGSVFNGSASFVLKNITGGTIKVIEISTGGDFFGGSLNGLEFGGITEGSPLSVDSGGELRVTGLGFVNNGTGSIEISYIDPSGLERQTTVSGDAGAEGAAEPVLGCMALSPGKNYVLTQDISQPGSGNCITADGSNISLNCAGKKITGPGSSQSSGAGIRSPNGTSTTSLVITNCEISGFRFGMQLWNATGARIHGNTLTGNDRGMELYYPLNTDFYGNVSTGNNSGFYFSGRNGVSDNLNVYNNAITGNVARGGATAFLQDSAFYGNDFSGNGGEGLNIGLAKDISISGNVFGQNSLPGLLITGCGTNVITLSNNNACGNTGPVDIGCSASTGVIGSGNTAGSTDCAGLIIGACT